MDTAMLLSDESTEEPNGMAMFEMDENSNTEHQIPTNGECNARITPILFLASLMATLGGILFGYDIGIVAGAILQLRDEFNLSPFQQEIIISSMLMGALIGSLLCGFIIDTIGRRRSVILNSFIFTAGALILTCATTSKELIIGRLILGFAISLSAIAQCIYMSEVSPSTCRGRLVSLNELGITLGILLAYLISYCFIDAENGWRFMFGFSIIPAIVQGGGMVMLPASPRYLIKCGKMDEGVRVLQKLRSETNVSEEVNSIKAALASEQSHSIRHLFGAKENMRSRMLIGCGLVFFQQMTGQTNVVYYAPTILQSIGFESDVAATSAALGIGLIKFLSTVICVFLVDNIGRRKFLLVGVSTMMFAMFVLGITTCVNVKHINEYSYTSVEPQSDDTSQSNLSTFDIDQSKLALLLQGTRQRRQQDYSAPTTISSSRVNDLIQPTFFNDSNTRYNNQLTTVYPLVRPTTSSTIKVVSLISLMVFVAAYAFSFGPVTWLILSEIYPLGIRGRATSLATSANWTTNLVLSMTFLDLIDWIGIGTVFISYGVICFVSIVFIYLVIPETKNKSLEEISLELSQRRLSQRNRHVIPVGLLSGRTHLVLPVRDPDLLETTPEC